MSMTITSKGQVTIPQQIRNRFGLKPGTAVEFVTEGKTVIIRPKRGRKNAVDEWLTERPRLVPGMTTDKLIRLTRGEG